MAPATPPGVGALSVVRISGPLSLAIADRIFSGRAAPSTTPPRTMLHGEIIEADGGSVDEVMLASFRAPHSFTGEDSVEISCHGAPFLVKRIVARVLDEGGRLAGPGEFTRRAFLNGRIDLAQAESVADLVGARTAAAARSALRQLHGDLSERLGDLRGQVVDLLADVEADLDFSAEEGVPPFAREKADRVIRHVQGEITRLVQGGKIGRVVREGVRLVLAGRTNSGKSTLFNAMLGEDRAIVSPDPGTTRDVLEGEFETGGILFHVSDTAGIRSGDVGHVEGEGIRRATDRREGADLLLLVVDGSEELTGEDRELLRESAGRKRIVVISKGDLPRRAEVLPSEHCENELLLCALNGSGMDELRDALLRLAVEGGEVGEPEVTSARHIERLQSCLSSLQSALGVMESGELLAEDLRAAAAAIGDITGGGAREELLDKIFRKFCLGK